MHINPTTSISVPGLDGKFFDCKIQCDEIRRNWEFQIMLAKVLFGKKLEVMSNADWKELEANR